MAQPQTQQQEWNTSDQIRSHQLATSIINRHNSDGTNYVFDAPSLATLKRFCMDPTPSTREAIMREEDWDEAAGQDKGAGTASKGSLVGYVIVKHGTDEQVFDGRDLELLKKWYEDGMPAGEAVVR
jgi:hypothetical protein